MSDRESKENFSRVEAKAVLQKVAELPVLSWNYKGQGAAVRHIGQMAQDFAAAFCVGEDNRHITSVDADGVALAAIQGLNEVVKEKESRIAELEKSVKELKEMVRELAKERK